MGKLVNIADQTFNQLYVVKLSDKKDRANNNPLWECVCTCGNTVYVTGANLRRGNNQSCGCLLQYNASLINKSHGMTGTKEYRTWKNMLTRCYNLKAERYADYGGRGIQVLYQSFKEFYADVGPCPGSSYSIERSNNNDHYKPGNCKWATNKEQQANKRVRRDNITGYTGVTKKGNKWEANINHNKERIYLGSYITPEKANEAHCQAVDYFNSNPEC